MIGLPARSQHLIAKQVSVDGYDRQYFLFSPTGLEEGKKYPLVIVMHGGGGKAKQMADFSGFNPLAESEKFLVLYPNGYHKGWHDGRVAPSIKAYAQNIDDVKFIQSVIEETERGYPVDSQRIFATGISNGAIMALHLANLLSDKIRAIALVCGSIPENQEKEFNPPQPVTLLVINGTADKLVPYEGGPVLKERSNRGRVISTEKMMERWIFISHTSGVPESHPMPDKDPSDGCIADFLVYPSTATISIELIRIKNGGHTWPGGKQYLPKMIVGNVCRDFKAEKVIWDFFKRQLPR